MAYTLEENNIKDKNIECFQIEISLCGKQIKNSPFTAFIQDEEALGNQEQEMQEEKEEKEQKKDEDDFKQAPIQQRLLSALQDMPGNKKPQKKGPDDVRSPLLSYRVGSGESDYSEEEYPERDYPDLDLERAHGGDNGNYAPYASDQNDHYGRHRGPPPRRRYPERDRYYDGYNRRGRPRIRGRGRRRGGPWDGIKSERDRERIHEERRHDERRNHQDEPPLTGFYNDYGGY